MDAVACTDYAAYMLEYDDAQRDEAIRHFADRYGKLSVGSAIQAHRQGEGVERLFALYFMGCLGTQEALDYLLTILHSGVEAEERASAICLANHRIPQAVPALIDFLAGPRGVELTLQTWQTWLDAAFSMSQGYVPVLLGRLRDSRAVPALREALARTIAVMDPVTADLEQLGLSLEWTSPEGYAEEDHELLADVNLLRLYQDSIVYALGQLGALGALSGFLLDTDERRMRLVHLLLGYLQRTYPVVIIHSWAELPALRDDLDALLERVCGLTEAQRRQYLDLYQRHKLSLIADYGRAEQIAQERGVYY